MAQYTNVPNTPLHTNVPEWLTIFLHDSMSEWLIVPGWLNTSLHATIARYFSA